MSRYPAMFAALKERGEGAFVPFVMVGDPDPDTSEAVIEALIAGGADALELGVPFTDPVADGPTIQRAHVRALAAGTSFRDCLEVVERVRRRHPQLPIGMLIYGNVPFAMGLERFYDECAQAGIDSVLLPDVPIRESAAFSQAAEAASVDAVYIAPPSAAAETLDAVAAASRGYVYAVSRVGVTGTERASSVEGLACGPMPLRPSCWASASPRPSRSPRPSPRAPTVRSAARPRSRSLSATPPRSWPPPPRSTADPAARSGVTTRSGRCAVSSSPSPPP